jgi:lipopolysaccharide transport system ATP-binding protein
VEILSVEDVWRSYRIPHQRQESALAKVAGVLQMFESSRLEFEQFWAVKGVSFKIERGESLGIMGANGSGKSTLLKIIAGTLRPTKGRVAVRGKVAPILELGLGFHPEVTVKENVKVYASIMGLRNSEIKKRLDPILEFAELERFRDAKLKTLSSGMQARLGLAVAVECDPELFVIDEALAVGDMAFQEKCMERFREFRRKGHSIILVSHSAVTITEFCDTAMIMSKGEVVAQGEPSAMVAEYAARSASSPSISSTSPA